MPRASSYSSFPSLAEPFFLLFFLYFTSGGTPFVCLWLAPFVSPSIHLFMKRNLKPLLCKELLSSHVIPYWCQWRCCLIKTFCGSHLALIPLHHRQFDDSLTTVLETVLNLLLSFLICRVPPHILDVWHPLFIFPPRTK